jgi:hypothetical protein
MRLSPQPTPDWPFWRRTTLALAAVTLLAGCGINGDFGEVNRVLVQDDIHDWIGREKTPGAPAGAFDFQLTDDERSLRDLAYPLLEPPYNRQKVHSVASEYGMTPGILQESADRTAYFNHLMGVNDRSSAARYAQLIEDIRNDSTRLPQFFETAGRVLDLDGKRRKSMAYVSSLSDHERNEALTRIRENARIVAMVRTSLTQRTASYRYALERLVIMIPSPQAADTERALNRLQAEIAHFRTNFAPAYARQPSLASSN